jgi:tetratricopeptide (TPR) repeat protein
LHPDRIPLESFMKIRLASALLALSLPLFAQDPAAATADTMFYKAFYLEKGQRDFEGAMQLYQKFLEAAPEHKLAAEAAKQQFGLLDRTGKTKERDAFKAKYEKLLGNIAAVPPAAGGAAGGDAPRGDRGQGGGAGRMDPAARMAELEKQLEKAKADGDAEAQKRLEQQIERMKQGGGRGPGGPGQGGPGGGMRGGLMGMLRGQKKIAEMSDEEITQLKDGIGQASGMIDMMRERNPEQADKLEKGVAELKKALDAGNKEDAQKAMDALREAMPQRRRGGGEGGGGGGGRPEGGGGGGGGGGGR